MIHREHDGRPYGIICIAEGLADRLPDEMRPTFTDGHGNVRLGDAQVGRVLAEEMQRAYEAKTGRKPVVRYKQIGYEARCAEPSAFDVLLGTQLGVGAYRALVEEGLSRVMVSVEDQLTLKYVPFDDLIDPVTMHTKVRFIDTNSDFYRLARALEYQGILDDMLHEEE
jgi:6-phosphofructokinase 1